MSVGTSIFKAYDIRGIYPTQINEEVGYLVARAFVELLERRTKNDRLKVAVGRDMRLSSPAIAERVIAGLLDSGADVCDIGLVSTPTFYFAVGFYGFDGGLQISASHNPRDHNGIKLVFEKALPVSRESGMDDLKNLVVAGNFGPATGGGELTKKEGV